MLLLLLLKRLWDDCIDCSGHEYGAVGGGCTSDSRPNPLVLRIVGVGGSGGGIRSPDIILSMGSIRRGTGGIGSNAVRCGGGCRLSCIHDMQHSFGRLVKKI